ncbi:MAG: NADAR family protein [Candidatus Peribacteraceae bacterium]|nr:NADAR family protein [Candidatus Peribacteraceae bacterium]
MKYLCDNCYKAIGSTDNKKEEYVINRFCSRCVSRISSGNVVVVSDETYFDLVMTHNEIPIKIESFGGEYEFLSNFYDFPIEFGGKIYPTTEHLFQAGKTNNQAKHEEIRLANTPGLAKKFGRNVVIRPDWPDIREAIMEFALRLKFNDDNLKRKLLATGDAELIEGNWWGDTYWGVCKGKGMNKLGIILMKIREEYRREQTGT